MTVTITRTDAPSEPLIYGWTPRAGAVVHLLWRVSDVSPNPPSHNGYSFTTWRCGNECKGDVVLSSTVDEDARRCTICAPAGVYLARVDGGLKVGHSVCPPKRMLMLKGELLDTVPGSRLLERAILDDCPTPIRGREWFSESDEPAIREAFDAHRHSQLTPCDGRDVRRALALFAASLGVTPKDIATAIEESAS